MGHIVAFEGVDRVPAYHRCEELADAVSFVEKLRNDRGVETAQIFRTEEVRFDFKPYYRVELGALAAGPASSDALAAPPAPSSPAPEMTPPPPITSMATPSDTAPSESTHEDAEFDGEHDDDDLSTSGSRRGLFGR